MVEVIFDYLYDDTIKLLKDFDCLDEGINNYLYEKAYKDDNLGLGNTHLLIDVTNNKLIGYYTLRNSVLIHDVGNNKTESIPTIEVYMFAIDKNYQGKIYKGDNKYSDIMFNNLYQQCYNCRVEISGARFIALNSLKKAKNFYIRQYCDDVLDLVRLPYDKYVDMNNCITMTRVIEYN